MKDANCILYCTWKTLFDIHSSFLALLSTNFIVFGTLSRTTTKICSNHSYISIIFNFFEIF